MARLHALALLLQTTPLRSGLVSREEVRDVDDEDEEDDEEISSRQLSKLSVDEMLFVRFT